MLILVASLLVALQLLSSAIEHGDRIGWLFVPLLLISAFGLLVLLVMVLLQLKRLLHQYRNKRPGSRLKVRMVLMFVIIALFPVGVSYYYSLRFLTGGIESWFDIEIDQAMQDSLSLSRKSLNLYKKSQLQHMQQILQDIQDWSDTSIQLNIDDLRARVNAVELSALNSAGQLIATSNINPLILVPQKLERATLSQLSSAGYSASIVPIGDEGLHLRINVNTADSRGLVLQALFALPSDISDLSEKVQSGYESYLRLSFLRKSLINNFSILLSLVILFSLLSAIWLAFFWARRIVKPIRAIADGTRAVTEGNYDQQLEVPKKAADELDFLVQSFNLMTRRISQSRDQAASARRQTETQRAYLQAILSHLSSGVIAIDRSNVMRLINRGALQLLDIDNDQADDQPYSLLSEISQRLQPVVELIEDFIAGDETEKSADVILHGDPRQILLCRLSALRTADSRKIGYVLVFDDVSGLVQAQRDAAWSEVARRLAHEIKNPLTPIRLSAERIQRRLSKKLQEEDAEVLDKTTRTIIQQVDALKLMVNDFSDYARPPAMRSQPLPFDELMSDILHLYQTAASQVSIDARLQADSACVEADPVRLRQVIHNLIKNAVEATEQQSERCVKVNTYTCEHKGSHFVALKIEDNGPGFDDRVVGQVFDPYVTSKEKGTGLGLAIVKKIVEEHGGMINAYNCDQGGACVTLRLPVIET